MSVSYSNVNQGSFYQRYPYVSKALVVGAVAALVVGIAAVCLYAVPGGSHLWNHQMMPWLSGGNHLGLTNGQWLYISVGCATALGIATTAILSIRHHRQNKPKPLNLDISAQEEVTEKKKEVRKINVTQQDYELIQQGNQHCIGKYFEPKTLCKLKKNGRTKIIGKDADGKVFSYWAQPERIESIFTARGYETVELSLNEKPVSVPKDAYTGWPTPTVVSSENTSCLAESENEEEIKKILCGLGFRPTQLWTQSADDETHYAYYNEEGEIVVKKGKADDLLDFMLDQGLTAFKWRTF